MDCDLFLDGYSEFRDGLLDRAREDGFRAHLDACASCARYDRVVGGGVRLLRDEEPLVVQDDFMARLQHRLYHVDEERAEARRRPRGRTVAGTLAAAAVAALTIIPTTRAGSAPPVRNDAQAAARSLAEIEAQDASTGIGARLEQVGVEVYPMPYREVLYRTAAVAAPGHAPAPSARGE